MKLSGWLKQHNITAPAILLFLALAAQVPHAMTVFVRVAPHGAQWEIWLSVIGGAVYAVALEGATAFFVWRSHKKWAAGFAVFSVLHNVAYYMPPEWTIIVYGAMLLWRNILGSVLISVSLPLAIAAFSHVQSQHKQAQEPQQPTTTTVAQPTPATATPEPTQEQPQPAIVASQPPLRKVGKAGRTNEYGMTDQALADLLGVSRQRIAPLRDSGTLAARVARDLPHLAPVHTNGFNSQQ